MVSESNQWYFAIDNKKKEGPISKDSLLSLRKSDRINDNTLVWSPGMKEWKPFYAIFNEAQGLAPPPLPEIELHQKPNASSFENYAIPKAKIVIRPFLADESKNFLGGIHHPWRRFFARMVDIEMIGSVGIVCYVLVLRFFIPSQIADSIPYENSVIIATIIFLIGWLPVEATLLSTIGTTPAKWLFGINITTNTGNKLSFGQAFYRTFLIALQGMGLYCCTFFTCLFAYQRLIKTGMTLWDLNIGCIITHKVWGPLRAIVCVFAGLLAFLLFAFMYLPEK